MAGHEAHLCQLQRGESMKTLYDILGVVPGVSMSQMRSAYRRRTMEHHP